MNSPTSSSTTHGSWQRSATDWVATWKTVDLVAFMTLFVVLLVAHSTGYQILAVTCILAACVSRAARHQPWMWFAICFAFLPRLVFDWYHNEDHVYLTIYWCAAFGLSRCGNNKDEVMACNARLLIGLAFAFAALWKISMPSFYDGSLCTYKLLHDYRFRKVITQPLCGLTDDQVAANHTAMVSLTQTGSPLNAVSLEYPDTVVWIGNGLAWWTILIESGLGIAFLLPPGWIPSAVRNGSLLAFALTTYLVVPVLGFALLFMTLGIAQTSSSESRTRLAYLATSWLLLMRFAIVA